MSKLYHRTVFQQGRRWPAIPIVFGAPNFYYAPFCRSMRARQLQ